MVPGESRVTPELQSGSGGGGWRRDQRGGEGQGRIVLLRRS